MPVFELTMSNGEKLKLDSPDADTAAKDLATIRQERISAQGRKEYEGAPWWGKLGMATGDMLRSGVDTASFGVADKLADWQAGTDQNAMLTRAAKERAGWAGTALDAATMAAALPTAVPKVMGIMGGGRSTRGIVGTGTSAAEGGLVGGLEAAGHDQPIGEGVLAGTGAGVLGHAAGNILGGAANQATKWWKGIDDSVPQGIRSKITSLPKGQTGSPQDLVTIAANQAAIKARQSHSPLAFQKAVKGEFEDLLQSDKKRFTKPQVTAMEKITQEDPGTQITRVLGGYLSNKLGAAGIGAAIGAANPIAGMAAGAGMLAGGKILRSASSGGTEEALKDLQRLMARKTKFQGPISPEEEARIMKGIRQLALDNSLND